MDYVYMGFCAHLYQTKDKSFMKIQLNHLSTRMVCLSSLKFADTQFEKNDTL